jgi:hypothetical protein
VNVRIDEMQPSMFDVGTYSDEAQRLLDINDDLMARLKAKESNIEDLLSQADGLVEKQPPADAPVYKAMAESMGTAWRDLNKQLLLRAQLLQV